MKNLIVLLLISSVLFAACKSEKQKEGIKKTEEMLARVDSVKNMLTAPEIEAYRQIYDTTKLYISFFENLPANFERTDSIMELIYRYGVVDKCFKKLHKDHIAGILEGLEMSKSQITNLQHDINEGFFEDYEIDSYIHIEDSILNDLEQMALSKIEFGRINAESYKELQPMIINLKHEFEEVYK
jgi:hypothetical protein